MTHRTKVLALLVTGASTLGLIAPQIAGAASSTYPPNTEARSFHHTDGGWHGYTSVSGACVPSVNCPTVTNDYAANGGAGGSSDGYLRTSIASLLGVNTTSRGIYQSPSFTYRGLGGSDPDKLTLRIARRSTLSSFLAVTGNSAHYSVHLVDVSHGGAATGVIHSRPIGARNSWTVSAASVPSGGLTVGDDYRLRITSVFVSGTQVTPGGAVGYDDVVLEAKGQGGSGTGGGGKSLRRQLRRGLGPVVQKGRHLTVRAKCPRSVQPRKCRMRIAALLHRHGPKVTNVRKAHLGAGQHRRLRFRVKHAYSKRVAHRKRVTLREKVKIGHRKFTVTKSVHIVRH
jgi:hypothetical protein